MNSEYFSVESPEIYPEESENCNFDLLAAVFYGGIQDFISSPDTVCDRVKNVRTARYIQAREWLFCDVAHSQFSFVSLCDFFGFNPDYIRRKAVEKKRDVKNSRKKRSERTRVSWGQN